MALTKVTYSMIQGAVANVLDFGADPTGVASSTVAFQAAIDSLTNGGGVYVPQGTYLLNVTDGVALDDNITMFGEGASSVIRFGSQDSLKADGKSNITITNIKFKSENARVYFNNCTNVQMIDCIGDGIRTSGGNLTQQGFWFAGCDKVLIENIFAQNYRDCIYLSQRDWPTTGTPPCGEVTVRGGLIEQTVHGSGLAFPTGIYSFEVEYTYVQNVTFKNIKPSSDAGSGSIGYGYYEGDGTLGDIKLVSIKDCVFIDDDGYTTYPMDGALITVAEEGDVDGCTFIGNFRGFVYGARNQKIQNCLFDEAYCYTTGTTGVTGYKNQLISNNLFQDVATFPLIIQNDGATVESALIIGNTFQNCAYGAWAKFVTYPVFIGNKFVDCNTTASAGNDFDEGAIIFSGPQQGLVDGNTVMNLNNGKSDYAVVSSATAHGIVVTANNYFKGMLVGPMKRPLTAPPTTFSWERGSSIFNWSASAGGAPGWVCTTAGTFGTLAGVTGSIISGTKALTVNTTTGLNVGNYITIAGVAGIKVISSISGLVVTINSNADATVSSAAVAYSTPVWKAMANLAA
jgi:hypothetical protein